MWKRLLEHAACFNILEVQKMSSGNAQDVKHAHIIFDFAFATLKSKNGSCIGRKGTAPLVAMAAKFQHAYHWNRCVGLGESVSRSFELPSESRWIGLRDGCRLPALPSKFGNREERLARRSRRGSSRSKALRAASKPRPLLSRAGRGCQERQDQDIARPKSSFSELSLPSPRDNDEVLSASAVLRAALTGSFLDLEDESLDLQVSSVPPWSPYSSSQDENHDSKCTRSAQSDSDDDYHLSATLVRCASHRERVPLSTLQLLVSQ